jgi:hypothetical protein
VQEIAGYQVPAFGAGRCRGPDPFVDRLGENGQVRVGGQGGAPAVDQSLDSDRSIRSNDLGVRLTE